MALSKLVYDRKGSGEPVVLIHGIGHRRQAWAPIFDQLAERYDVIAVDLAGFGESPRYAKGVPYNMDNACADLAANFAEWGIERPHVVGNSLGGAVSLELAARGLVSSVTVLSPAGFFGRFDRFQALGTLTALRVLSQAPDFVLRLIAKSSLGRRLIGYVLYTHPERFTAEEAYGDAIALKRCRGFEGVAKAGLRYRFGSVVDVPTTVAWGTRDRILPYSQAALAEQVLPDAKHVPLPDCGHVPMIDDPDLILRLVNENIAEARRSQAA
jgi:pimeloyl-ACP methyl ester carboxylesterase